MVNGNRGYSLNKIDINKQNAKIDVIKLKCFQTSKLHNKCNSKQMTNEKELEGD